MGQRRTASVSESRISEYVELYFCFCIFIPGVKGAFLPFPFTDIVSSPLKVSDITFNDSHLRHVCNCWNFSNVPRMMWKNVNDMSP